MEDKQICDKVFNEYNSLVEYMHEKNIYNIVKKNERFYSGDQWHGLEISTKLAKPTMNKFQHIGKYMIATMASDDVGVLIEDMVGNEQFNKDLTIVSKEVKRVIEVSKILETARLTLRDGFVDGAGYMHQIFDPEYETGQESKGCIDNEQLDIRRVLFGNPYSNIIQKQPYIIIVLRQYVEQVREEAKEKGCKDWENIKADADTNYDEDSKGKLCTVLLKYYKKKKKIITEKVIFDEISGTEMIVQEEKEVKTVHFIKCTKDAVIIPETDLGYSRYPISRFGWEQKKDSFLFESPMTQNITNQVFINKMYGYIQEYLQTAGTPKRIIDETKMSMDDIDATTLGVAGIDLMGKVMDYSKAPDFSNQVTNVIDKVEAEMKENMGVNDAALGNVRPDNAQAIMALQESATVPLQLQMQAYKDMWEDTIRNIIDIMTSCYHTRKLSNEDGESKDVDFDMLKGINYNLVVDTGSSAQYSEIYAANTASSLLNSGQIDLGTFAEIMPSKNLGGNKIPLKKYAEKQEQMAQQLQQITNTK